MTMNRAAFFAALRPNPFGGSLSQSQVAGMSAILDAVPANTPLDHLAYALATTFHETGREMRPVREKGSDKYLSKYDTGKLAATLGNTPEADGDGIRYCGRGDVQLTGLANYLKAQRRLKALFGLDVDLVGNPDAALDPKIATLILFAGMTDGWFTGRKLADYFGPGRSDAVNARRIINGLDCADLIAGYFRRFQDALMAAGYGAPAPAARAQAPTPSPTLAQPAAPALGLLAGFLARISGKTA